MKNQLLRLTCLLSGVSGASELAFLKEPSDVIAVRDRPLSLDCQVEGEGPLSITWRRNGVPVATGVRATVLGNGTLFIKNFSKRRDRNETDAGDYDCAVQNRYGMLISRKARVQLASLPKFLSHPESVLVDEGGVARLTCQVHGIPEANITWQRDQQPLSTGDPRYTLLPNGVLQITGVRRTDSGLFRCVASNIANTRYSQEARLSVTIAGSRIYQEPTILSGPQNLTINIHQTAILECIATGNPRPIVSWSRLDGRSIGVEGIQVLGTGNLMISDVNLQHSGVYVCSANRPGSRSRRTALGRLVVQAPPEFIQWPQSVSRPEGGSAVFSCTASAVPEPHLIWLKNGKLLTPSGNVKLTNGNTTLAITRITPEDEAIYQCIAENSAGTNQASARLAISQGSELPEAPTGLRATALSPSSLQLTWEEPTATVIQQIIGYVLHIRRLGEPDSAELQEAVSKTTFKHEVNNLDAATTYSIYLKAYSALGGSQQSSSIAATTLGGGRSSPPKTSVHFSQFLHEGPQPDGHAGLLGAAHVSVLPAEPAAVYEIQLLAFNGNGDSPSNRRLVSLEDRGNSAAGRTGPCNCDQSDTSMSTLMIGIHSSLACVLCFLLFILLGYRRRYNLHHSPHPPSSILHHHRHHHHSVLCSLHPSNHRLPAPDNQPPCPLSSPLPLSLRSLPVMTAL
uniref:Immunoglobulin superfamily DCC subclass member 3 n=1 Tax=Echeneis naucrates TaxID=173247 RepID=A0A665TLF0_ECHNA